MPRPRSGRQAVRKATITPNQRAMLAAWCHAGPVMDGMGDPSEASWRQVREAVWRRWVAQITSFSSPGYSALPYAAVLYDGVPDDVSRVPSFAMPALAAWNRDQREFRERRIVPDGLTVEEAQAYLANWIKEQNKEQGPA